MGADNRKTALARPESRRRAICFVILVLLGTAPRLLLGAWGVSDGFAFTTTALASNTLNSGQVQIAPYPQVGNTVQAHANDISLRFLDFTIAAVVTLVGGGSVKAFQFLPTAGIAFMIMSYALGLRLLRRAHLALAFALFLSYEPVTESLTYNWYPQGWAFTLYFLFIILLLRYMKREGSFNTRLVNTILLLLTYVAIFFTYYAAEMYVIVLTGTAASIGALWGRRPSNLRIREPRVLALVLAAMFLFFEPSFYYVAQLGSRSQLANPLSVIAKALSSAAPTGEAGSAGNNALYTYSGLALYVVLIVLTLVGLGIITIRAIRTRKCPPEGRVYWGLAITGTLDVALYSSLGFLSLKFIDIVFPLLALGTITLLPLRSTISEPTRVAPRGIPRKQTAVATAVVIVILVLVGARFAGFKQSQVSVDYGYTNSGMSWIVSNVQLEGRRVFGDLLSMEKLLVESTSAGITNTTFIPASPSINFDFAYANNCTMATKILRQASIDYVLVSQLDIELSVPGTDWQGSGPLGRHATIFGTCSTFNLLHSDGAIYFYMVGR